MRPLPRDCTLLPTRRGGLLVSPSHATFCPLPREALGPIREVLATPSRLSSIPDAVLGELERHGFFDPPRSPAAVQPTVSLQLTNACNLACGYCCTGSATARPRELALSDWKRVVDQALEGFGAGVRFGVIGGEPLLVPYALDLAEYIAALDARLALYTNGLLLQSHEVSARVAGLLRRGAEVRVSLAGVSAATCDRRSGTARFERVLAGLSVLASHGSTALVDLMLFPADVDEVAAGLPELRRRLPRGSRLSLGLAYHGGRELGGEVFHSRAELESALDRIALEAGEEIAASPRAPLVDRRDGCSCALGHSLNVRSDGQLFSCFRMEEPVSDMWTSTFGETLASLREHPRPAAKLEPCSGCALNTLCGGGCRSENLLFSGDAERPVCGPWRVEVISELLAEDRVSCLEWSAVQLAFEARARGIAAPEVLPLVRLSTHVDAR